ncbi:hypothetical protein [Xylophilus sp.]|uniref:hypothetical protein n=1 Tax=Xylophilus sp. TaxID=2653893 RepID=UPI002D811733|nr:hypothetical protein [Xylophilus sp.]
MFRKEAAQPNWVGPMTWRDVRLAKPTSHTGLSGGRNGVEPVWVTHDGPAFDRERYADEVVNLRHTGWFTDNHCNGKARGIVVALPHGRFLAGYHWDDNGERCYFGDLYDDEDDATRAADSLAERFAEDARADSERFDAMQDAEGHCEAVASDVDMAYQARNVSARHREHARGRIEELRAARRDFEEARAAYEGA